MRLVPNSEHCILLFAFCCVDSQIDFTHGSNGNAIAMLEGKMTRSMESYPPSWLTVTMEKTCVQSLYCRVASYCLTVEIATWLYSYIGK